MLQNKKRVTVSGIPLNIRGLSEQYEAEVTDPGDRLIDLIVTGPSAKVAGLRPDDFTIFIDLSGLTDGNHDVNIHVEGPSDINWKPDKSSAKITISRRQRIKHSSLLDKERFL